MSVVSDKSPVPLSADKATLLDRLTDGLDEQALIWLSGYAAGLAGRVDATGPPTPVPQEQHTQSHALTVLYGSQTGNARRWAERIHGESQREGYSVGLVNLAEYQFRRITRESCVIIVISTQGDGEPPDDALGFTEYLQSKRAPKLNQLRYAVLALGDSSYPLFCATGRAIDKRLKELGASRLTELGECDLDIETVAEPWWQSAFPQFQEHLERNKAISRTATVTPLRPARVVTRESPESATVLVNQRITAASCDHDVRHIELAIDDKALDYAPGDSLGVWHRNPEPVVEAVLQATQLDGTQSVSRNGETLPLHRWLVEKLEVTRLSRSFVEAQAERSVDVELKQILAPARRNELSRFLERKQVYDLLQGWPADWSADALVAALPPLTPRLYSIASSPAVLPDEIHLTVARVAYKAKDETRLGAASFHLCETDDDSTLPVYVEPNTRFRLPQDQATDIILVGTGTGVAPFRAFVEERAERGADGRNWLFFGARHFHSQFLYQLEWQRHLKQGTLHDIELAFSRDQAERVYVQDRLAQRGRDVFAWLEGGAHFYVCGGIAMEKTVRKTLTELVSKHGACDNERAEEYLKALQREGRYCRDVY